MPCCDVMLMIRPRASPTGGCSSIRRTAARQSRYGPRRLTAIMASQSPGSLSPSALACEPAGMPGVAFVAHCLLNQNSKTKGGARCPGVYSPLVEELRAQGWQMQQMPCPELAFTGLNRFWAVREQLDTRAYRTHFRRLATAI